MPRSYKIKSYKRIYRRSLGSVILQWILILAVLGLLFLTGWTLYEPVSEYLENRKNKNSEEIQEEISVQIPEEIPEEKIEEVPIEIVEIEEKYETLPTKNAEYISQEVLLNNDEFLNSIAQAKENSKNSLMFDLKSKEGYAIYPITYHEKISYLYTAEKTISLAEAVEEMKKQDLSAIAALYAFMDTRLQKADWETGIFYADSNGYWLDNYPNMGGKSWLNPYSEEVKKYLSQYISDAADAGFEEIIFREFTFPVGAEMEKMNFLYDKGKSKVECLRELSEYFHNYAEEKGINLWIEYPASAVIGDNVLGYGGEIDTLLKGNVLVNMSDVSEENYEEILEKVKGKTSEANLGILNKTEISLRID